MLNALTVDVEDYYQVSAFEGIIQSQDWGRYESRVVVNTNKILSLLAEEGVKATFFILGYVAEKFPELVKKIDKEGHEVATHGYSHRLIYEQNPEEFSADLKKSIRLLEGITQKKPIGHRAASFSITQDSLWAFDILIDEGLKYDSSVFPIKHSRYGIPDGERYPYLARNGKSDGGSELIEFPLSTLKVFGRNLPFSGGGYLRLLPYPIIKYGIKKINKIGKPAIVYIHPWELDPDQPRQPVSLATRFRHYVNLSRTEEKLKNLLRDFKFVPVKEVLNIENAD